MMLCGLGMQQYAMHNAQCNNSEDNLFELGVYRFPLIFDLMLGGEVWPITCLGFGSTVGV